jgi:hypothetical protein
METDINIGISFRDLTKFKDDADLKNFIVTYLAPAIVEKVNDAKATATRAADVAITDRDVSIGLSITIR